MNIFITGHTGFVGKNLITKLNNHNYSKFIKTNSIKINEDAVLHFAGKAHDLKNVSNSKEYYDVNRDLTNNVYQEFLNSDAKVFIVLSSVKAVADVLNCDLTEDFIPNPITHYGKSKFLAEKFILEQEIPNGKRVYILRPCMIHGPGNKGNLNLLYKIVSKGFPWPLGAFENKRSFCSIDNLCYIINDLLENDQIPSGVYNIADDESISTNELIKLIYESQGKKVHIWRLPKILINTLSRIGDMMRLPFNTDTLSKLTENYVVSNKKIIKAIGKPLPVSSKEGLLKTFKSFHSND